MIITMILVMREGVIKITEVVFIKVAPNFGVTVRWVELIAHCRMLLVLVGLLELSQTQLIYIRVVRLGSSLEASWGSTWWLNIRKRKTFTNLLILVSSIVEDELISRL